MGADREAALLRWGSLPIVFRHPDWTIYEVPSPTPILSGGALDELGHERVAGRVDSAGPHRLRVRWTPYWEVRRGDVCLRRAPDGMTTLVARREGAFELAIGRGGAACG
jgi:hypothetical protein